MPRYESFNQAPPQLGNQFDDDEGLRSLLRRQLPEDVHRAIEPELREMGRLAGGELYRLSLADRLNEPTLTQWDPWGRRIDHIELTRVWHRAERIAAEMGVVAAAYEDGYGPHARMHQFALAYLFGPSTDTYSCPLAMTDGAARSLLDSDQTDLIGRAVPHLISRDPAEFWTSGQWMTESTGGSDVSQTETVARPHDDGTWRLWGRKWFTSAATSQVALTLARPEGGPEGSRGLAMFYVETFDRDGSCPEIRVNRLKDKLGTRKLPTAELSLEGLRAWMVGPHEHGVRQIAPMLNITRTWNGVTAASGMRRGMALARDYAGRRRAFGAPLSEKPLHVDTLAGLQAEAEGALHFAFRVAGLIGMVEAGDDRDELRTRLRTLTPLMKLTTARQAVRVSSEQLECFGGAGYVEDTGLPSLLRDSQVLSIWEGTTNVLALDTLRALAAPGAADALTEELRDAVRDVKEPGLSGAADLALRTAEHASSWLSDAHEQMPDRVEAGARRFALSLGRALELAYLCGHAEWALTAERDPRPRAAALRLAANGVSQLAEIEPGDSALLAAGIGPELGNER